MSKIISAFDFERLFHVELVAKLPISLNLDKLRKQNA